MRTVIRDFMKEGAVARCARIRDRLCDEGLVGGAQTAQMKGEATPIDTVRGGVVDDAALDSGHPGARPSTGLRRNPCHPLAFAPMG